MVKTRRWLPWLAAGLLFLLGLGITTLPGYRFSALITFGIAALVVCFQLLKLAGRKVPRFSRYSRRLLTVFLCVLLLSAAVTGIIILRTAHSSGDTPCQYLIVLGAGVNGTVPSLSLRERLDAAFEYLNAHPDTVCVVSGGQGPGEEITEAACMAQWLIDKGIDPQRILPEDKATSTEENLAFSLALIEEKVGTRPQSVGILSSEYHLYRAGLMARDLELEPVLIPAKTQWISLRINYYLREIAAVWYYWVFG